MPVLIALADANSFYASCEQVFNPSLVGQPVVVASNNDGCVVACSALAKTLGIKIGVPLFKIQAIIEQHRVQVFSSNYTLYGDLASRVVEVLNQFTPVQEVYSIDESFLRIPEFAHDTATDYGQTIRTTVKQWTGVPICLGMGPSKVLAKIATIVAKRYAEYQGVFDLRSHPHLDEILDTIPVQDIWGIGRRHGRWLRTHNIHTALQFRDASEGIIRRKMGVVGVRLLHELQGVSCLPLDLIPSPQKSTQVSRSFGRPVETREELAGAIATYATRAAEKLRAQHQVAAAMLVFAQTHAFGGEFYKNSLTIPFDQPTNYTPDLIKAGHHAAQQIFQPGYRFQKAGVLMIGLGPETEIQGHLWISTSHQKRQDQLMQVMDRINQQFGHDTLTIAAAGLQKPWQLKSQWRSPRYTTCWNELPVALA